MNITRYNKVSELDLSPYPALSHVVDRQIVAWPEHEPTIATSLGNRHLEVMQDTEDNALMVTNIANHHYGGIDKVCEGYRYFCQEMILAAELYFRRHGKYERSSLDEAVRDVYSKPNVMEHYMNGLLISGILWHNHAYALNFYRTQYLPILPQGYSHLEIGPGHGALLHLTATDPNHGRIVGWDVSPSSIEATKRALEIIGVGDEIELVCQDMFDAKTQSNAFDSIVVSELLEHLEDPLKALKALYVGLKPGGHIYVNMPANSPAPDHLYLIEKPQEMTDLIRQAGYTVEKEALFPMTGHSLERCKRDKLTITCIAVGQKKDC